MRHLLRAALPLLAALLAAEARAEGLRLGADTQRALRDLDQALKQLAQARAALSSLEAGQEPKGAPADWSDAPEALAAAADALRRAPGPVTPDPDEPGGGPVPLRAIRSCATRAVALGRLERRQRGLQAAAQRTQETRALLRERLAAVQAGEEARRQLARAGAARAGEPAVAEAFPWRWADLDGPAAAALASAAADLSRHLERVERSAAEHRTLAAEAGDQLAVWSRARDCLLAGSWSGTRALGGAVSGLSARLASSGDAWSGTVTVDGASVPVRSVALQGSAVTIALADGRGTLSGTLSGDGRSLAGSFSSPDGLAAFQLRRQ